jgi:hypothetical protein
MIFPVQIINYAQNNPQVSVTVADAGVPAVTYAQVRQSLGTQVYKINELYLYSENINQLLGVIQYQIFDSNGNQKYSSIATTIDPYEGNSVAIDINLREYKQDFILNGNSSFSATILPNTYIQVKFYANRVTNEFGGNLDNFQIGAIEAGKPNFYNNYGSTIEEIKQSNVSIQNSATIGDTTTNTDTLVLVKAVPISYQQEDCTHLVWLGIAAISVGVYLVKKDKN